MTQHLHAFTSTEVARFLPVLMYHAVATIGGPLRGLGVPPERLRQHLAALTGAGYRVVGLSAALERIGTGEKVVALTFDDAYANVLAAVPVLADHHASATLYVPVGDVDGPAGWRNRQSDEFGPIMNWPQLHEVVGAGLEIGNQGLVHAPMDVLRSREIDQQVRASHERLVQEIQTPVRSFSYPYGYNSAHVRAAVEFSGHDNACQTGRRLCRPTDDRFAIPRVPVTPDLDAEALLALVEGRRSEFGARLRRLAQPSWRAVRRMAYRFGWVWT